MITWTLRLLVVLGVAAIPSTLYAQTARSTLRDIVASADVIAETEIVDIRPRWERGLIVSTVFAEVTTCVHGRCPNEVVSFEVMGGELDGMVQVISGSTVPQVGDRYVLLLVAEVDLGQRGVQLLGMLPIVEGRSRRRWVEVDREMVDVRDLPRLESRVNE